MKILEGRDFADYIWEDRHEDQKGLEYSIYTAKNLVSLVADFNDLGLFHRDLKPGNLFYLNDKTSFDRIRLILIDFAFSSDMYVDDRYKGTKKYMPNEMLAGDRESDWYN